MPNINKAILVGHVGNDPEIRYTSNGKAVANFHLATTQKWDGNEKTQWHKIVAWGKTAELCEKYVKKGDPLYVEGSIEYRQWEDKDGNRQYTTEIIVREIQFLGGKRKEKAPPVASGSDNNNFIPF